MTPLLRVENLTKTFDGKTEQVVDHIGFDVWPHEILVVVGPSGCGKTTALRLIAGLERPNAGSITVRGKLVGSTDKHVPPDKRGIGFVFQDYALFPHLSVLKNVTYGLRTLPRSQRIKRAMTVLDMVNLANMADRRPHELSGGQQQRVALARSMAPAPQLILLDEPFSNLDASLRITTRNETRALLHASGMSAVLVTHDQEEAMSFGDRVAVMHDGRFEQIGRPEDVYRSPASPFVADFLGRTNLMEAEARGSVAMTRLGPIRLTHDYEGDVLLSVRPEHLGLTPPRPGRPTGKVITREFKGHDLTFCVEVEEQRYLVQTDFRCPFLPGDAVHLYPIENAVVLKGKRVTS